MRMLRNQQDAEDALQETFLQVYRGLKSFEGRSNFSTWLFRLATNVCLMKIRHRGTEPAGMLPLEDFLPRHEEGEQPSIQEWPEKPEEILLTKESREKMMEALDNCLPIIGPFSSCGTLRGFQRRGGRSPGDFGGGRKIRLHRARIALRGMLAEYFEKGKFGNPALSEN